MSLEYNKMGNRTNCVVEKRGTKNVLIYWDCLLRENTKKKMNIMEEIFRVNGIVVLNISTVLQIEKTRITFLFSERK